MKILGIIVILLVAVVLVAKQWGKSKAKAKQSEELAKDAKKDADISSKSFDDNPLDKLR